MIDDTTFASLFERHESFMSKLDAYVEDQSDAKKAKAYRAHLSSTVMRVLSLEHELQQLARAQK
jgi:hypothetical protein